MIIAGFGMIIWGIGNGGQPTGISNLWTHGGFFAHGLVGMLLSLQMVMFAYGGIEIIGITAGEPKILKIDPESDQFRSLAYFGVLCRDAVRDYGDLSLEPSWYAR